MVRQDDLFEDLKLVRGVDPAYRACLAEAVRRKASMKLYMGIAGQLAEKLAMKRETEVRRHEEFLKTHGLFVPQWVYIILPVSVMSMADVDRYAPEYLVGLQSKVASSRSSLGMSSDSSLSAETEEIGLDSFDDILQA